MGALTDKYCIVGVGETPHMRPSNRTTLSMACEAVTKALADAGLKLIRVGRASPSIIDSDATIDSEKRACAPGPPSPTAQAFVASRERPRPYVVQRHLAYRFFSVPDQSKRATKVPNTK